MSIASGVWASVVLSVCAYHALPSLPHSVRWALLIGVGSLFGVIAILLVIGAAWNSACQREEDRDRAALLNAAHLQGEADAEFYIRHYGVKP